MKKIKTLLPVLLTTATVATTASFAASCSKAADKIRMIDVEDLFTNGWTRETSIHDPVTLPHGTDLTKWYLDQVNGNKAILRDDAMADAFPKPAGLVNEDRPAKGNIGLEIGDIVYNSDKNEHRLDFNLSFVGTATKLEVPEIPGIIDHGYLTGELSVLIKVKKIKMNVQRLGLYTIYADYFKSLVGVPWDAEADLGKLITDVNWSVNMDVKWKGGISPTKEGTPEIVDHEAKSYKFDWQWVLSKRSRSEEAIQALANLILPQAFRSLGFMKNVKVA